MIFYMKGLIELRQKFHHYSIVHIRKFYKMYQNSVRFKIFFGIANRPIIVIRGHVHVTSDSRQPVIIALEWYDRAEGHRFTHLN